MRDGVVPITRFTRAGPPVMTAITPPVASEPPPSPAYYRCAPGHGPGVATSGSSSTFVSKSWKPRRR